MGRNMKELEENDLHLYIINKSLLGADVINEIENKLAVDESFREEIREIEEFYNTFESLENQNAGVFTLKVLRNAGTNNNVIKLAAMRNSKSDGQNYIKTFLSGEDYLFARLFYLSREDKYRLYIIDQENMDRVANCVVKINNKGNYIISDENGIVLFGDQNIADQVEIKIIIAAARFEIDTRLRDEQKIFSKINTNDEMTIVNNNLVASCKIKLENMFDKNYSAFVFEKGKENKFTVYDIENGNFSFKEETLSIINVIIINKSNV